MGLGARATKTCRLERVQSIFVEREGRHKACPYRGRGGRLRGTTWVGDRWHRQYAGDAAPTWHGVEGGVAGGIPPHKGGPKARPHRTAVVSDQWSVVRGGGTCADWGRELAFAQLLPELYESSPSLWTAPWTLAVETRRTRCHNGNDEH